MNRKTDMAVRVAENAPAMLVYLDSELRVRFANRHCYELLGHAPREVLGRLLAELVDPGTLKYALEHIAEVERGNAAPRDYVLRDKEGAPRYVQVRAVPDRDPHGRSVGYFACTSDNAEERELRAALAAANERLSFALAASQAGVWDWDLAAQQVHYSPEFGLLLGHPEGQLPAAFSFFDAIHPEDAPAAFDAVALAIQEGGSFDREFRMRCADGSYRWLRGVGRAVRDPASDMVARFSGTVRDISPRKQAERHLREANELACATVDGCLSAAEELAERRKLDRIRRGLVATANHELRTPLAAIIAALDLLREETAPERDQAAEAFLGLALRNAERLARVVEQWLDVERIDLGASGVERAPLDLGLLLRSALAEHAALAEERGVRVEVPESSAAHVESDPQRLVRAISHLLSNAIERSPRGGLVRVQLGAREGRVTLLVEDEGPEVLTSADLGISIAKAIVERLGGTACYANRPHRGAAFHLELPRA